MCHTPKPEPVTPQSLLGLWRGIQVRSRVLTIIHIIRSLMACTKRHISLFCVCTQSIRSTPDFSRANGYSTSRRHPSRCGTTGAGGSQRALDLAQICSTPVAIGLGTLGKCCAGSFTGDTVCARACVNDRSQRLTMLPIAGRPLCPHCKTPPRDDRRCGSCYRVAQTQARL